MKMIRNIFSKANARVALWRERENNVFAELAARGVFLRKNERRLASLRDAHKGQRCFIIGNGPSLNQLDLKLLANEVTFGVNAIYTNYEKMGFYPTYHVVEDRLVAEDRASEINQYTGSRFKFFGNYLRYCLNPDEGTIVINVIMNYDRYKGLPRFSVNALEKVWVGGTVSYLCMQLAFYMGFSEVYLIGFDHSYSIPKSAKVDGYVITSTEHDVNHFNSAYFGKGLRWHDPMVDRMEEAYKSAKKHYEASKRKIYNATAGGKLEVFERVKYESLF
jgi:hypothetical protein